jgi:ribosomal protein S18 acetylase RimI-like enzyme
VTLPEPILSFWSALLGLHQDVRQTPWGTVVTDSRYPRVYEANHACILRHAPHLTVQDVRTELLPALEHVGAGHEHIEFMDADDESPALHELLATRGEHDPDVVMIYEGDLPTDRGSSAPRTTDIEVLEMRDPDESFWERYRLIPNHYDQELPDGVLDQMLARVRELFVPAGERFLVGRLNGAFAGMASVLTLHQVAYVDNVVTLPEFRGRGVASATVDTVVQSSLRTGAKLVFLLTEENGAPQRLYERLGFQVRRRCYGFTHPLEPEEG